MADAFQFRLITPAGVVFSGDADRVSATGALGDFGVLPAHANFITALAPGFLEVKLPGGAAQSWVVSGGLAEVKDGAMTVLANGTELPDNVDGEAAAKDEKEAGAALARKSTYDPDYPAALEALQLARARMRAAALKSAAR
ncbi:MAG: ATP synthase F1 subunit epsilon [Candidatus Binataceae bacterium]